MIARGFLMLTALFLVSCKPVNGNIVNDTGGDIKIVIKGMDGATLAYGSLRQGTALSMKQNPQELATITYHSNRSSECRMSQDRIGRSVRKGDEIWIIRLRAC